MTGTDVFAVEGTSAGEHKDGPWRAGVAHAGRWCDVFEVRDFLIQRCFIYLDPDYAGLDTGALSLAVGGRPRCRRSRWGDLRLWVLDDRFLDRCSSPRHADGGRCDGDGLGVRSDSTPRQNGASARVQQLPAAAEIIRASVKNRVDNGVPGASVAIDGRRRSERSRAVC